MSVSLSSSSVSSAPISPSSSLLRVASATEIRPEVVAISLDDQISALSEKYKKLGISRKNLPPDPEANWSWLIEMFELKAKIRNLTNQKSEQEQKQLSDIFTGQSISSPTEKAASVARENAADNLYFFFAQEIKKHLAILAEFKRSQTDLANAQIALGQSQETGSKQLKEINQLHAELDGIKREKDAEQAKAAKSAKIKRSYC